MKGNLPPGWIEVPLSQVAEVRLGRQRSPDKVTGDHMRPYVRAANVTWQGIDTSDVKQMNFSPKEFAIYELKDGDILLSEASGSASEVGKPAVWRNEIEGCCFQNTLIRVRSRGPLTEYLHLHFLADARLGRFATAGKGIGINHLGADRMSSWPTRLPPVGEQRRIVAKLEALQARRRRAREALDAVPPLLEKLRQSILAAAFRGDLTKDWRAQNPNTEPASALLARIRTERRKKWEESELAKLKAKGKPPTDDRWKAKYKEPEPVDTTGLPELPEGWCWASVDEVSLSCDSQRIPVKLEERAARQGRYPYYGAFGIIDHVDGYIFDAKLVLVAEDGKNLMDRKRPIATVAAGQYWVNNHAHVLDPVAAIPHEYLAEFFNSVDLRERLTGIDQVKLTAAALATLPVPVAPPAEAREVARFVVSGLGAVDRMARAHLGAAVDLAKVDSAVLAKAFRGELVPQDPNDEPAEAMLARLRSESASEPPRPRGRRSRAAE